MKTKDVLFIRIEEDSKLIKEVELPSVQGLDAVISAYLLLGYSVTFLVRKIEVKDSEHEN